MGYHKNKEIEILNKESYYCDVCNKYLKYDYGLYNHYKKNRHLNKLFMNGYNWDMIEEYLNNYKVYSKKYNDDIELKNNTIKNYINNDDI
jgi:hypothetical protein